MQSFRDTLFVVCIDRTVCVKTQEELHQKVRFTVRVPRVVLKSNSQYCPQDPQNQDARSFWEPSSDSKSYGEICNNTVDHRILGVPLSAVEPQNTIRENKVNTNRSSVVTVSRQKCSRWMMRK